LIQTSLTTVCCITTTDGQCTPFVNTWEETVKQLEPEIRKLFLYEQKLAVDIKMGRRARTLEYEKLRLALIGDVEFVALDGYCSG
jgi:hypothetical protein